MPAEEPPLDLLYRALNSSVGIEVETDNLERFRQRLYAARATDEDLRRVSICVSPDDPARKLWLVRKPDAQEPES